MAQWTQGIMLACCCGFRVVAAPLRCPSCVISVFLLTERWLVGGIPKAFRILSRHRSERRGLGPNMHGEDVIRVYSERSPRSDFMAGFVPWFRRPGAALGGLGGTARRELRFWRYTRITSQITHQGRGGALVLALGVRFPQSLRTQHFRPPICPCIGGRVGLPVRAGRSPLDVASRWAACGMSLFIRKDGLGGM